MTVQRTIDEYQLSSIKNAQNTGSPVGWKNGAENQNNTTATPLNADNLNIMHKMIIALRDFIGKSSEYPTSVGFDKGNTNLAAYLNKVIQYITDDLTGTSESPTDTDDMEDKSLYGISMRVKKEEETRGDKDAELEQSINDEIFARDTEDTRLEGLIDDEATDRANADNEIKDLIQANTAAIESLTWNTIKDKPSVILTRDPYNIAISKIDSPKQYDILIIQTQISEDKYAHTGYIYNILDGKEGWIAFDGNYSADNVYFDDDMMVTKEVGYITLTNGQGSIPSRGKNLKEVFEAIWVRESDPEKTNPSVSVTLNKAGSYEVGTTITGITYSASFEDGKYDYGPEPTGAEVTVWEVTDTSGVSYPEASGNLADITVTDGTNFTITAKATYTDGDIPNTNKGNPCSDTSKRIFADSTSGTSNAITGYRNTFYGALDSQPNLTSSEIRGLSKSNKALSNGSSFSIPLKANTRRVVIAYPSTLRDITSVLDENDSNSNIVSAFTKTFVQVDGAAEDTGMEYKVYYIDFAKEYGTTNKYKVTI